MQPVEEVSGELLEGVVKTDFQAAETVIGSLSHSAAVLTFTINNNFSTDVLRGYLELHAVVRSEGYAQWKLWFDSVPLTKEFKPNYTASLGGERHSLFIFDVTPILRREPRRKTHKVVAKNLGSAPIRLNYAFLVTAFGVEGARTRTLYEVYMAECSETYACAVRAPPCDKASRNWLKVNGYVARPPVELILQSRGLVRAALNPTYALDLTVEECLEEGLLLKPAGGSGAFLVTSVAGYASDYKRPRIELKLEELEKGGEKGLRIEVANVGEASADNVFLVGLVRGNPAIFKKVGKLKEGDRYVTEVSVDRQKEPSTLTVRAAWTEYGDVMFVEKKVTIQ